MNLSKDQAFSTNNIYAGLYVKNYPTLCQLLNEEVKGGKSKILQLHKWERFFKFEPQTIDGIKKRGFNIIEIYQTPKAKAPKPHDVTNLRNLFILEDLLHELDETKPFTESIRTTKELTILLGICNEDYYEYRRYSRLNIKKNPIYLKEYNSDIFQNVSLYDFRCFYEEVDDRRRGLFTTSLSNLQKHCMVEVKKTYIINKDPTTCSDEVHTEIEKAKLRTLQLEAYLKTDKDGLEVASNENDIFLSRKYPQFIKDTCNDSQLQELGIKNFYVVYKFRFTADIVNKIGTIKANIALKGANYRDPNDKSVVYHIVKTKKIINVNGKKLKQLISEGHCIDVDILCKEIRIAGLRHDFYQNRILLITKLIRQFDPIKAEPRPRSSNMFAPKFPWW
jgi:hypothetical protein